jgi:hypothetical protein
MHCQLKPTAFFVADPARSLTATRGSTTGPLVSPVNVACGSRALNHSCSFKTCPSFGFVRPGLSGQHRDFRAKPERRHERRTTLAPLTLRQLKPAVSGGDTL